MQAKCNTDLAGLTFDNRVPGISGQACLQLQHDGIFFRALATFWLRYKCTGCAKSHCAKARAYCPAFDHLICKISSGMFQKSSSFEEFNDFSKIDVYFFE